MEIMICDCTMGKAVIARNAVAENLYFMINSWEKIAGVEKKIPKRRGSSLN